MRRVAALALVAALLSAGCSSAPGVRSRSLAKGLLLAADGGRRRRGGGAAVDLGQARRRACATTSPPGSSAAASSPSGTPKATRWNRAARAAVLVGGLALVGLVITWQMGLADRYQSARRSSPERCRRSTRRVRPTVRPPSARPPGGQVTAAPQSWAEAR